MTRFYILTTVVHYYFTYYRSPRQAETKLPEMMLLHQVLPKDENGNKKMVETFLEGKMMLTDPMNGKGAFINYSGNSLASFLPPIPDEFR